MNAHHEVIELLDSDDDNSGGPEVRFVINRKPVPLARPRFYQKGIYSKNKADIKLFQNDIKQQLSALDINPCPFTKESPLSVTIRFFLKRPNNDFKANKRGVDRLKTMAEGLAAPPFGSDIDNLAKFVLDGMNKIVYDDDRQIVHLVCYRLRDNIDECLGRTEITISPYINQVHH
jgi:Holliday junction resolvase RusA-like endonuclease